MPLVAGTEGWTDHYVTFIDDELNTVLIPEGDGIRIQYFTQGGDYVGYTPSFANEMGGIFLENSMGYGWEDIASAKVSGSHRIVSNTYTGLVWDGSVLTVRTSVYDQHADVAVLDYIERMIGRDIYDFVLRAREGTITDTPVRFLFIDFTVSNPLFVTAYFVYLIVFGGTLITFLMFVFLAFAMSYVVGFTKPNAFPIPLVSKASFILRRVVEYRVLFHVMFIAGGFFSMYLGVVLATVAICLIVAYELKVLKGTYLAGKKVSHHRSILLIIGAGLLLWTSVYVRAIPYAVPLALVLVLVALAMALWRVVHRSKKNRNDFTLHIRSDNTGESTDIPIRRE